MQPSSSHLPGIRDESETSSEAEEVAQHQAFEVRLFIMHRPEWWHRLPRMHGDGILYSDDLAAPPVVVCWVYPAGALSGTCVALVSNRYDPQRFLDWYRFVRAFAIRVVSQHRTVAKPFCCGFTVSLLWLGLLMFVFSVGLQKGFTTLI